MKWTRFPNIYAVLVLAAISFSCASKQDPLRVIKFGQDSVSHVKKIISEIDDSWALKKFSKYIHDNYDNQIASSIRIVLSSDSSYVNKDMTFYAPESFSELKFRWMGYAQSCKKYPLSGPLPSSIIDSLWDLYHKWYGTPDFLYKRIDTIYISNGRVKEKYSLFGLFPDYAPKISSRGLFDSTYDIFKQYANTKLDTIIIDSTNTIRKAFWNTENYQVSFTYPNKSRYLFDTTELYCGNAEIEYRMKNYEEVREHMADSIRKAYQINDLIQLYLIGLGTGPQILWTDYGWIAYTSIERPANLDQRLITSVRYEIIMKDAYDEVLYRSAPQTLDIVKDARKEAMVHSPMRAGQIFYYGYISFLAYDSELLKVRNYAKHNEVQTILRPLAVVFSTGEVLRRND